jgi:hypothetical protein
MLVIMPLDFGEWCADKEVSSKIRTIFVELGNTVSDHPPPVLHQLLGEML